MIKSTWMLYNVLSDYVETNTFVPHSMEFNIINKYIGSERKGLKTYQSTMLENKLFETTKFNSGKQSLQPYQ